MKLKKWEIDVVIESLNYSIQKVVLKQTREALEEIRDKFRKERRVSV
jgi:hypothetical protein